MTCCAGPIVAHCAMSPQASLHDALLADLNLNRRTLADGNVSYLLSVPAIHCGSCITTIEKEILEIEGVKSVRANLSLKRVALTLEPGRSVLEAVVAALENAGFSPRSLTAEESGSGDPEFRVLVRSLAVAGFATANIMLLSVPVWNGAEGATRDLFHFISALIAIPSVAFGGLPFFRSAYQALKHRRMNMDVPISLGVMMATGMSIFESFLGGGHAYFDAAVSLLFFLLVGRTLDQLMRSKARAAAEGLARLSAKGGYVVKGDGALTYVPIDNLAPGLRIRIAVGERFPVDGEIVEGTSDIDRALVTGESEPQRASVGGSVEAGTLNLTGPVDIIAKRAARDSFLAEVTQMMASAESGRSAYVRVADRLARIYAPAVHVMSLGAFMGWMAWTAGDVHQSLTVAVAVLIITCPCALGLAVPVAQVVAAGRLFAAGVLMKDGSALERMEAIDTAVFDKTGTLTTGEPVVHRCDVRSGRNASIAKALALRSMHPAAKAMARHFNVEPLEQLEDIREVPGNGVEAMLDGQIVRLGRKDWVEEIAQGPVPQGSGVAFAVKGEPLALTALAERVRPGAQGVLDYFRASRIRSVMLSGDSAGQVEIIARKLGFEIYVSELKPGEKLAFLQQESGIGHRILMVGDGLNDAPALAAAHVSMAPSSGSDIGRMAADFVFTRDDLSSVSFTHRAAVATGRIVRQNFALAIIYNLFAVPLAMTGQLNPLLAAIAMSTSSIIVIGNSLRLYQLTPKSNNVRVTDSVPTAFGEARFAK